MGWSFIDGPVSKACRRSSDSHAQRAIRSRLVGLGLQRCHSEPDAHHQPRRFSAVHHVRVDGGDIASLHCLPPNPSRTDLQLQVASSVLPSRPSLPGAATTTRSGRRLDRDACRHFVALPLPTTASPISWCGGDGDQAGVLVMENDNELHSGLASLLLKLEAPLPCGAMD
uniref:Uncharacterized protein n=1 Tax=Oryza glumipatula TaxID=40148 RepID=A0A0E0BQ73_9ORYZ